MEASDWFDDTALDRLQRVGGLPLVHQIVSIFLQTAPERIQSARSAAGSGDLQGVRDQLHSLVSSAGNLGGQELESKLIAGYAVLDGADGDAIERMLNDVEKACDRLIARLQVVRDERPEPKRVVVAVVEDNADNRLLTRAILQDRYDVLEFATGAAALEAFATSPPDVVLLDISLPGMDGMEVLDRLRRDATLAKLPIIALTAHSMDEDRARYLGAGFDGYVSKPILDENILLEAIEKFAGGT